VNVLGYIPQKLESGFKRRFSVVMGQKNQLWWDIPAADSFLLFKEIYQIPQQQFKRNVSELSELLEVEGLLNTPVRNLSLGERMKMELIATILHEPEVIFLDEPTIGLDVFSRRKIRDFLKYINKERQVTILLTSHYIEDIKALCSRIIAIQKGKIVYDGPFEAISKELVDSKRITVSYENNALIEKLQRFAQILERSGNRATFLVKKKSIREFCEQLTSDEDFYDMNIEDVPVDEIFEKLFQREEGMVI
jgi:ABC-2 type transport system ATP-binding protein